MLPPDTRDSELTIGWSDEHDDDDRADNGDALWEQPTPAHCTRFVPRIGVSGAVRELHRAFVAHFVRWVRDRGRASLIVTLDTHDWSDATYLRETLGGVWDASRIVGVAMGSAADTTIPDAVANELIARFPDADLLLFVGHATTARLAGDTALAHYAVALTLPSGETPIADLRVMHTTNETDGTVMRRRHMQHATTPTFAADCIGGRGLDAAFAVIWDEVLS